MTYYVDENIKATERVFPDQGRYAYHRFDMNENSEGLPKEFVDSVLSEITPEFLAIYPEPDRFLKKYADFVGVGFENVTATNGTDQAIRYVLQTFCGKGHEVVTVSPSFEMYWVNCSILGLKHVPVAYKDDMTIDVDDIIAAITPNTDIVVLLNPNNPMGNVYTAEELEKVIAAAHKNNAIVLIDEAYHYFCKNSFLHYAVDEDNVIVLRTFSKLFSIASCRLGVIVSNPQIIDYVKRNKLTFDVNSIALLFGERLVENRPLVERLIATERDGRDYTLKTLEEKGYEVRDCQGNFIFVKPHKNAVEVTRRLHDEEKVLVKCWSSGFLAPYLRVSTGSREAMQIFIDAFLRIDND